jgi:regulator of sigma E protease
MILTIVIAFFSLIGLIILHELGHFILAKKFGVKVEEFGIGYPPRIFGKKFGETIYSINLLPLGAFVRIYGQEEKIKDPRSFSEKPIWQRISIILGGVVAFWIAAAILLSIVMSLGVPTVIGDEENHNLVNPKVQIVAITSNSPAQEAGLRIGDTIKEFSINNFPGRPQADSSKSCFSINKVKELQELTETHKGEEVILTIQRGKEIFDVSLIPRTSPPEDEGPMGIALLRTALKSYPWYQAPFQGILATGNLTVTIVKGWSNVVSSLFTTGKVPPGVEIAGPPGIFRLFIEVGSLGVNYFLQFIAIIAVHLALINILPIPALDGGWLLFLIIEKIRGKPINQKIVQRISAIFFILLVILIILISIRDIRKFF